MPYIPFILILFSPAIGWANIVNPADEACSAPQPGKLCSMWPNKEGPHGVCTTRIKCNPIPGRCRTRSTCTPPSNTLHITQLQKAQIACTGLSRGDACKVPGATGTCGTITRCHEFQYPYLLGTTDNEFWHDIMCQEYFACATKQLASATLETNKELRIPHKRHYTFRAYIRYHNLSDEESSCHTNSEHNRYRVSDSPCPDFIPRSTECKSAPHGTPCDKQDPQKGCFTISEPNQDGELIEAVRCVPPPSPYAAACLGKGNKDPCYIEGEQGTCTYIANHEDILVNEEHNVGMEYDFYRWGCLTPSYESWWPTHNMKRKSLYDRYGHLWPLLCFLTGGSLLFFLRKKKHGADVEP